MHSGDYLYDHPRADAIRRVLRERRGFGSDKEPRARNYWMQRYRIHNCPLEETIMNLRRALVSLAAGVTFILLASEVLAVPKGPGGQTCKSSGTATVNGKEESTGRAMKCTADYCKYDECETSGPNIGKCYEKTSYSNVRDCKPAAMTRPPSGAVMPPSDGVLQQVPASPGAPPNKLQRMPMAPSNNGVMRRGVEGEQPASSEREGK